MRVRYGVPEKHLREEGPIMPHRQQRSQIKSHESGVARDHDPVGFAISINHAWGGVGRQRIDGLALLGSQRSAGLQLGSERANDWSDIVIEDRREISVAIARQQPPESRGMS